MMLQALHADKKLKEMGKKDQIIIKTHVTPATSFGYQLPLDCCTIQGNQ
jgi:adenylate kinase